MLKNFSDYLHKTLSEKEAEEMNKNAEVVYQKPLENEKKHYHYLIGYQFQCKNSKGFGENITTVAEKISSENITEIRQAIRKAAYPQADEDLSIVILSISPLECGCEDS